jgi:predicted AlkP superfamily phosphohydrolase/phosphomutase
MPVDLSEFTALTKKVEELQKNSTRNEGAIGQLLQTLKKEFNCKSVEEAEKLRDEITEELEAMEEEFEKQMEAFQSEYGEQLGE